MLYCMCVCVPLNPSDLSRLLVRNLMCIAPKEQQKQEPVWTCWCEPWWGAQGLGGNLFLRDFGPDFKGNSEDFLSSFCRVFVYFFMSTFLKR